MQPLRKHPTFEEVANILGKFRPSLPENRALDLVNSPAIQQFLSVSRDLQDHEEHMQRKAQIDAAIKQEAQSSGVPAHVLREQVNQQRRRAEAARFNIGDDSDGYESAQEDTTNVQVGQRSLPINMQVAPQAALASNLRAADDLEEETKQFENEVRILNLTNQLAVVTQQQNLTQQFAANLSQRVEVASPIIQQFYQDNRVTVNDNRQYQMLQQVHQYTVNNPVQVANYLAQHNVSLNNFLSVLNQQAPNLGPPPLPPPATPPPALQDTTSKSKPTIKSGNIVKVPGARSKAAAKPGPRVILGARSKAAAKPGPRIITGARSKALAKPPPRQSP